MLLNYAKQTLLITLMLLVVEAYHSIIRVNARHVNPGVEPDSRWALRVVFSTKKLQLKDFSFIGSLIIHIKQKHQPDAKSGNIYFHLVSLSHLLKLV